MLVAMLAGCAGESPDERSVSAPTVPPSPRESVFRTRTLEASCADLATARCSDFVLCASFADRARFADGAECVAHVERACIEQGNLPGVVGAAERAESCARAMRAVDCNDRRDPAALVRACSVPGAPPRGTLADNAPCVDDAQCEAGACVHDEGKRCGTCRAPTPVGTRCATSADCGTNELYCAGNACAARLEIHSACAADGDCRVGLSCLHGTCAIGAMREGEICLEGTNACDPRDALRCLGEEWTRCVRYEIVAPGGSCADASMGLPVLCGGADTYCRTTDWKCVHRVASGLPCVADADCGDSGACVQLDGRSICVATAEVCQ